MGLQKMAFASKSERDFYYKLAHTWGGKLHIFPNLPFANIFRLDDLPPQEQSQLKKTSVDYTLCDEHDRFVMCIEFDGMCRGVNVGTEYQPFDPPMGWRQHITELKLRVAHAADFPFFVLWSAQFKDIAEDIPLMIVDGIIGRVMAQQNAQERMEAFSRPSGVHLTEAEEKLLATARGVVSDDGRSPLPVEWRLLFEVTQDMEQNPVTRYRWHLWDESGQLPFQTICGAAMPIQTFPDDHPLAQYRSLFPNGIPDGDTVIVQEKDGKTECANVSLHDFKTPGFTPFSLGESIAHILAMEKIRQKK